MYRKINKYLILFAVMALVSLTAGIATAATVTQSITYQGKLTDAAGNPLTGTYTVTFKLYDVASGGTALATDTHSVTATGGLFTTTIAVTNPAVVDGRALWLGITVGSDAEMTPRQEIRPVPYAMGLRPWVVGASFTTISAGTSYSDLRPGVNVSTASTYNPGALIQTNGLYSDGIRASTAGSGSFGLVASTSGTGSRGVSATTSGTGSYGVSATTSGDASRGVFAYTSGDDSDGVHALTWGDNSPAVFGDSRHDTGVYGIGKTGGFFTTNQGGTNWWTDRRPAINVSTIYSYNPGIYVDTLQSNSPGVYSYTHGANSQGFATTTYGSGSPGFNAYTAGLNSPAVRAESALDVGVYGKGKEGGYFTTNQAGTSRGDQRPGVNVSTANPYNPGVLIRTTGPNSDGVHVATDGHTSLGVYVETDGADSAGVFAQMRGDYSQGVWSRTTGSNSDGVYVETDGDTSPGVYIETDGADSHAVEAFARGPRSQGVYAESLKDVGVYGRGKEGGYFTTNEGGTDWWTDRRPAINVSTIYSYNPGIYVDTLQSNSPGVYAYTHGDNSQGFATTTSGSGSPGLNVYTGGPNSKGVDATSAQSYGLYGHTGRADQMYGIYTPDYLYAKGTQVPAADVAEYMPVTENVTPGTVLVIGEDGKLKTSTTAYDTGIAGIVSTAPGVTLGTKEGGNPGEQIIAVAGRVPCKADTSNGPIHPRDLLTTSRNPGYAMKATNPQVGTVLGKAMGTLESGTGTIEVLVTLQ
jgi:hypothetical protein